MRSPPSLHCSDLCPLNVFGTQASDRVIRAILREVESRTDFTEAEVLRFIDELRRQVVLTIAQGGEINPLTLDRVKGAIDVLVARAEETITSTLTANEKRVFTKGIETVDAALKAGGIRIALPYLDETEFNLYRRYSADLITNLSAYARGQIKQELVLATTAQKPINEVIASIGRSLDDPSIFATVAERARVITATEMGRIFTTSTLARGKQVAETIPMVKEWKHSGLGIPRLGHLALDGVRVRVGEPFILEGADGVTYEVDGPLDPQLPASEVVSCRCRVLIYAEKLL